MATTSEVEFSAGVGVKALGFAVLVALDVKLPLRRNIADGFSFESLRRSRDGKLVNGSINY